MNKRAQLINAMVGQGLFGRKPSKSQLMQANNLVCAASVMLDRQQSNAAYDVIMAGFALFEVSPSLSIAQIFEALRG